jgi:hypothetical protein
LLAITFHHGQRILAAEQVFCAIEASLMTDKKFIIARFAFKIGLFPMSTLVQSAANVRSAPKQCVQGRAVLFKKSSSCSGKLSSQSILKKSK